MLLPLRPRTKRASFPIKPIQYGLSVLGAPLLYFQSPKPKKLSGLIIAGTHGDDNASMVALSCALRSMDISQLQHHVLLAMNPDGCQLGTRTNAKNVDLNRNFATRNWQIKNTVYRWNNKIDVRDVQVKTGSCPASEPETQALCALIKKLKPCFIVSFHEPIACIDDPIQSDLGYWLAAQLSLPLVSNIGYASPGSFSTWCAEHGYPCITAELPAISADLATEQYLIPLIKLLSKTTY